MMDTISASVEIVVIGASVVAIVAMFDWLDKRK